MPSQTARPGLATARPGLPTARPGLPTARPGLRALLRPLLAALALCALLLALAPPDADAARAKVSGYLPNCEVAVAAAASVPRSEPTIRLARAAICLINQRRVARGMRRLRINGRLTRAAAHHTRDMVRNRYFGHVSRRGHDVVDRLRRVRYLGRSSWRVGENLAWGSGVLGSPRKIVRAWMNSPAHRRTMLDPRYREVGIGVVARGPIRTDIPAATYTTTFGVRH